MTGERCQILDDGFMFKRILPKLTNPRLFCTGKAKWTLNKERKITEREWVKTHNIFVRKFVFGNIPNNCINKWNIWMVLVEMNKIKWKFYKWDKRKIEIKTKNFQHRNTSKATTVATNTKINQQQQYFVDTHLWQHIFSNPTWICNAM